MPLSSNCLNAIVRRSDANRKEWYDKVYAMLVEDPSLSLTQINERLGRVTRSGIVSNAYIMAQRKLRAR